MPLSALLPVSAVFSVFYKSEEKREQRWLLSLLPCLLLEEQPMKMLLPWRRNPDGGAMASGRHERGSAGDLRGGN